MADTVAYTHELKIDSMFVDGDTRIFNIKNPKSNISATDITNLETMIRENNLLVGDKYGGRFGRILTATKADKTTVTLDLDT